MESASYRLETTFSLDGSSVVHTTGSPSSPFSTTSVWTTTRPIGRGGNGTVDLQSTPSGHVRAVKRVFEPASYTKEIEALSKISDNHELFVKFLGWYEDKDFLYIAMEFVPHGDLGSYIKACGNSYLSEQTCRAIARQVLEGLLILHERLICHRDLKPQNILVSSLEPIRVKITDFGASKYVKDTECRTRVGTVGYIAPEVLGLWPLRGRRVVFGFAVDMWAAGCIVHELLSLQRPCASEVGLTEEFTGIDCDQVAETDMLRLMMYCLNQLPLPVEALERCGTSLDSMEVVRALLRADPATRVSAPEILEYPWLLGSRQPFRFRTEPTITQSSTPGASTASQPLLVALGAPPGDLITRPDYPYTVKALYHFEGSRYHSGGLVLSFMMFEILEVLDISRSPSWWSARNKQGKRGWIPSNYVAINTPPQEDTPSPIAYLGTALAPEPCNIHQERDPDAGAPTNPSALAPLQPDGIAADLSPSMLTAVTPNPGAPIGKHRLAMVVDAAVQRSAQVGNHTLGLAIKRLYADSLSNPELADLLNAVLVQKATREQVDQFRSYVLNVKRVVTSGEPASAANSTHPSDGRHLTPVPMDTS